METFSASDAKNNFGLLEDHYWTLQAESAEAKGYLSSTASKNFLDSLGKLEK